MIKLPGLSLQHLTLRSRLLAFIVAPMLIISVIVSILTYVSLGKNAEQLTAVLKDQAQANKVYQLLLIQDDASKAILVDPELLTTFSEKKIEAYDQHKVLLRDIAGSARSEDLRDIIGRMQALDEKELRPVDTAVLEKLFEDSAEARKLYFDTYEPSRKKYEAMVQELLATSNLVVSAEYENMKTKNSLSLLVVSVALLIGVGVITGAILILGKQVEISEKNLHTLLSAIPEGLFFFDESGNIAKERSSNLELVLPGASTVENIQGFAAKFSNTKVEDVGAALKLLWQDDDGFFSDTESTLAMLPRQVRADDADNRIVRVEYRPLYGKDGKIAKIAAAVADITQRIQAEQESKRQSERVKKITMIAANIQSYREFSRESENLTERAAALFSAKQRSTAETSELKRILHTLKGSVGTFEFAEIAARIHNIESMAEEHGFNDERVHGAWQAVKQLFEEERSDIETILDIGNGVREYVDSAKINALKDYAERNVFDPALRDLIANISRVPLKQATQKFATYLEKLSERHGDKSAVLRCASDSDEISHAEIQKVEGVLVHLLRNCFDHGIEDTAARTESDKPEQGIVSFAFHRTPTGLSFVISDDGAGINTEKLTRKAVASGIWKQEQANVATEEERIALIFRPSLSTKDEATDLSGRGIGMDAVKSDIEDLGGTIKVATKRGAGTTFEIRLPFFSDVPAVSEHKKKAG